jgi:hypothetical protein
VKRAASITVRIAIIGFGILLTRHSASSAAALPNLSGSWKLNAAQSDDPQKMRDEAASSGAPSDSGDDAAPPSSGSGGGGHRGGRGWGGRHRGGRGDGSGGPSWLEGRESLVIRHTDPELDITDAAGHERTIYTDGRKAEEEHSYGGTTKVVAEWKDGHIEVTLPVREGPEGRADLRHVGGWLSADRHDEDRGAPLDDSPQCLRCSQGASGVGFRGRRRCRGHARLSRCAVKPSFAASGKRRKTGPAA